VPNFFVADMVATPQAWILSAMLVGEVDKLLRNGVNAAKLSEPYRSVFEWAMGYASDYRTFPSPDRTGEQFPDVFIPLWDERPLEDVFDLFYMDLNSRMLRAALVEVGKKLQADDVDVTDALSMWEQWNTKIAGDGSRFNIVSWKETVDKRFDSYKDRILRREDGETVGTGILTGIRHIDDVTHGFLPGNYVLVLGRFDSGKTTLVAAWTVAAAKAGNLVMVISPEHNAEEMIRKIDAVYMESDPVALRRGTIDIDLLEQLEKERRSIRNIGGDIKVIPGAGFSVDQIGAMAIALKPDFICVDGISHLSSTDKNAPDWLKLGGISKQLKALATNTGIPIATVIQEAKGRKGDAKDSIARSDMIGRDADIIVHIEAVTDRKLKLEIIKYRETLDRGGSSFLEKGEDGVKFIETDGPSVGGQDGWEF